ncbi:MAG: hypothetical protein RLZZ600_755 [Actinomycetota bacterium]|jgi:uncharacterized protein YdhG (YjbR/CyaY superfamily)
MPFESVDDYLSSVPEPGHSTLLALIAHILDGNPDFALKLAWNVPQVHRGKDYIFGMSAAKKHLTLAPWGSTALDALRPSMTQYVVNKGTFQVPLDWAIDENLINSMIAVRLAELD